MTKATRKASSPTAGGVRDAVRTMVGFGVAFLLVKIFGEETATGMTGMTEGIIVVITSAIFAFMGKSLRNAGSSAGKVI